MLLSVLISAGKYPLSSNSIQLCSASIEYQSISVCRLRLRHISLLFCFFVLKLLVYNNVDYTDTDTLSCCCRTWLLGSFFKAALYTAMLDENSLTTKKLYKRPPHVILFPLYPWSSLRCWQLVGFSFDFSHRQRYYYTDCVIWEFLLVFNRSISKMILFLSTIYRHNIHKMLRFF